jgi:hypothetical protein
MLCCDIVYLAFLELATSQAAIRKRAVSRLLAASRQQPALAASCWLPAASVAAEKILCASPLATS